ncbi:MAG: phosphate ABC transporter permease subunit PstC [Dehalococcoidia bacterium]|nr:phosphate ABC transporter permease subunit PstC [Dehalococcoidia bacterium]
MVSRYFTDRLAKRSITLLGVSSILIMGLIVVFIVHEGMPAFREVGLFNFIFGTEWRPSNGQFGIWTMILGSVAVTLGTLVLVLPLGIGCAILLAELAPFRIRSVLRIIVETIVGIPSVVHGLVGMALFVPFIRNTFGGSGYGILPAILVLTAMVLPTVVSITEDNIRSVPGGYKEGSLALGATHWQTIWHVQLPAARSGIGAAIVLGVGRAVGETMAMIMVIGNSPVVPHSILSQARTLTGNIAVEIMYATGLHESALFATGVVLLVLIMIINSCAFILARKGKSYA